MRYFFRLTVLRSIILHIEIRS